MASVVEPAKELEHEEIMTGCEAVAHAIRLADVDVMAAYPIRPYDSVMSAVSKMIGKGQMDAEFIVAESEHSQFEIAKHASAVGARTFIGSLGVGWMYGMEALVVTASLRLPVLALVGNG
ncbi:MAG: pyruvate ferredoxin oxidoreductase, partial [Firmicutes bacterium]|nr:pyruvate ferredoxin oxidoreductase [Bacillota bacterium]